MVTAFWSMNQTTMLAVPSAQGCHPSSGVPKLWISFGSACASSGLPSWWV